MIGNVKANPKAMAVNKFDKDKLVAKGMSPLLALHTIFGGGAGTALFPAGKHIDWDTTCFASWGDFDWEMIEGEYKLAVGSKPPFRMKAFDIRSACGLSSMRKRPDGLKIATGDAWQYMSCQEYAETFETSAYRRPTEREILTHENLQPHHALYDVFTNVANLRHAVSSR